VLYTPITRLKMTKIYVRNKATQLCAVYRALAAEAADEVFN